MDRLQRGSKEPSRREGAGKPGSSQLGPLRFWNRVEDAALVAALGAMIALAFTQIVLRNLGGTGLYWADSLLRYLVLWIGLLGAMIATRERHHINVDLVSFALPKRVRNLARLLTDGFGGITCAVIALGAVRFVLNERADQLEAFAGVPAWLAEIILPVSFGVMSLRFLGDVGRGLRRELHADPEPAAESR